MVARFLFVCLTTLADILLVLAMAGTPIIDPKQSSLSYPPTLAPSHNRKQYITKTPEMPELDKHKPMENSSRIVLVLSPYADEQTKNHEINADELALIENRNRAMKIAQVPVSRRLGRHHSSISTDKSVTGGRVILGGVAITFLVTVFWYIRVTRRRNGETTALN
ncbi:hypothetical protein BVC80_1835g133 [Macleaya cordata]|uniref:Uncharacterized protein n=1 Tax=Macleaya cordata TaxID=56857 RepID=A0A200R4X4_MACCD|nr:hypothetical protein BVC80_1835g133 [Macleaya cordata]